MVLRHSARGREGGREGGRGGREGGRERVYYRGTISPRNKRTQNTTDTNEASKQTNDDDKSNNKKQQQQQQQQHPKKVKAVNKGNLPLDSAGGQHGARVVHLAGERADPQPCSQLDRWQLVSNSTDGPPHAVVVSDPELPAIVLAEAVDRRRGGGREGGGGRECV